MKHVLDALLEGSLNALGLGALPGFLSDPWGSFRDELLEPFTNWAQDLIDNVGASVYQEALERVRDLSDAVEMTQEVFHDIGEAIQDALDSGETPPQTDGGLGQVHDNYTPDGDVPIDVGTLPGFSSGGAGLNRNDAGGGGGGGGGGQGAPSSGNSSPTPLGQSGGDTPSEQPMDSGPSLQDLGADPDSGGFVEYQPGEGQAVVHYPDGTTETYPWP